MRGRASEEVASTLQQADSELKDQALSLQSDLRSAVDNLSTTLASRVLGVEVTGAKSAAASVSGR
jgi:F-type H+-transporting ATPase subunit b